ncbi:MAG: fimbrillin family protein [Muribaculaceae bacterium]|nr:fimbrillin family protein [Muribaculaceae bacterium]
MNIKRVTYFALAAFAFAASCSKEAAEPNVYDWADGKIYFKTSLSDVAYSRAQDMTLDRLESFQVTCFNTADRYTDQAGFLSPYFENATFIRNVNSGLGTYVSSPAEEPRDWPSNNGFLRFFAFSPSLSVMTDVNTALEATDNKEYFNLINSTTQLQSSVNIGYRLGKVRINPDILHQFDFVTAEAAGTRLNDFMGGVELAFSHKLCQVELKAWGASEDYNFEIAGVRIGNPVVEGTFVFADDADKASAGRWDSGNQPVMDRVEYIYRGDKASGAETEPSVGDRIFRINSQEHSSMEMAASIMGQGGCAMVIPTVNDRWEALADPNIGATPYSTDRMYFSILMRVTDKGNGSVIYPYSGKNNGMVVISYAVDSSGNIVRQLYAGQAEGSYFYDPELQQPYVAAEGEEIKDFGWAAVPVDADWSAGKKYIYTLDYSAGIGLHDPADTDPGKPIGGKSPISWGVTVSGWDNATPDGDEYTPDLDVPGKGDKK